VPRRSRGKSRPVALLVFVLLVVAVLAVLVWRQLAPGVRAGLTPTPRLIGQTTSFTLALQAGRGRLHGSEVRIVQGEQSALVRSLGPDLTVGPGWQGPIAVEAARLGLKEGAATLEVWARDDYWRPLGRREGPIVSYPVTVDLTPPTIDVLAATRYLYQGGGGLVAFRLRGADRAQVRVGTHAYPAFRAGPEHAWVALFALPWDFAAGTAIAVTAQDDAGNDASRGITSEIRPRRFRADRIELTDAFLQAKVPELLPRHPATDALVEGFLVINRDQRRQAEDEKRRVAARTADRPLWSGAFAQPRNTQVFSNFAEGRTYLYRGQVVDTSVHLGFDLASVKQSPVPVANNGVVAFAGPLTIYGNTVIVDHGLGLQTLYGHLSRIDVKVGDQIQKGQPLGRTGTTGLAVGDHVHFEVLIGGVSVTPVEWWDEKWIRDRIATPLAEAGLPPIAGIE
jgi:murein DD-endopeptidase MepM/ murein hydrolase activator NlpD